MVRDAIGGNDPGGPAGETSRAGSVLVAAGDLVLPAGRSASSKIFAVIGKRIE